MAHFVYEMGYVYIYILIDDIWMIINIIYDIISNMILSHSKLIDDFPSYKPPFIVDLPLLSMLYEIGMVYWDYNLDSTPKFGIQIL